MKRNTFTGILMPSLLLVAFMFTGYGWLQAECMDNNTSTSFECSWEVNQIPKTPSAEIIAITPEKGCPNGCSLTAVIAGINPVSCAGGSDGAFEIVVTGCTPPYSFFWSNGQIGPIAYNLSSGYYTITIVDNLGCTVTLTLFIPEPPPILITTHNTSPAPVGGTGGAVATVVGGTSPYSYLWSDGQTTATAYLPAGTHQVTVTDSNGCTATNNVIVVPKIPIPNSNTPVIGEG